MPSKSRPDDEPSRKKRVNDEEPSRKKRVNVSRKATTSSEQFELVTLGIAVGLGFFAILPNCIFPPAFFFSFLVGMGLSIFGFVKGCLVAGRYGNYVDFDYLSGLGPLRWLVAIFFFGLYLMGYLALWTFAQVTCAINRPKAILPWFGIQAYGFLVIVLGMVTGAIGDRLWHLVGHH